MAAISSFRIGRRKKLAAMERSCEGAGCPGARTGTGA